MRDVLVGTVVVERGMIRLGGGQGFYGDGHEPVADVLDGRRRLPLCEALAELTLAILQKDRQRDEALGYTRDLPRTSSAALPYVLDGRTKVITNAGGINPIAAGPRGRRRRSRRRAATGLKIATVVGDDVRPPRRRARPARRRAVRHRLPRCAPDRRRARGGADIVITGRVADASLFLAPLVHEHGWAWDDWDRLAAGVLGRSPARVLRPGDRRQLLGRLVGEPGSVRIALPDRRGRRPTAPR